MARGSRIPISDGSCSSRGRKGEECGQGASRAPAQLAACATWPWATPGCPVTSLRSPSANPGKQRGSFPGLGVFVSEDSRVTMSVVYTSHACVLLASVTGVPAVTSPVSWQGASMPLRCDAWYSSWGTSPDLLNQSAFWQHVGDTGVGGRGLGAHHPQAHC